MAHCCIIGGGVVGLSIARELAGRGHTVRVLARHAREDAASWAAVGIFPPAPTYPGMTPNEALTAYSHGLHQGWSRELLDETGIDNGLRSCGGLHVAADDQGLAALREKALAWRAKNARSELLDASGLAEVEPALAGAVAAGRLVGGMLLPDEQQFRSPRHLRALEASCRRRGVVVTRGAEVTQIDVAGGEVKGVVARIDGTIDHVHADAYVLAAGAWSGPLAEVFGLSLDTRPIRGQIALLHLPRQPLTRIVNRGLDYLVPREEGRLLAGSTLEDVGFDATTTPDIIARLQRFAIDLLGDLAKGEPERTWAGLRPGTPDGVPFLGRPSGVSNAVVAAGHLRAGLHQSAGTAAIVADLVEGREPAINIAPFAPNRRPGPATSESSSGLLARARAEMGR